MVATKKDVQKRRIRDQRRAEAQAAAAGRKQRRRRLVVGGVAGTLAVAMVASLGVGFLASGDEPELEELELEAEDVPLPAELRATSPGASITGETPCPATDGTQERTTSFENPPPTCIDPAVTYRVTLATTEGDITVAVDTADLAAANLFVTNSWYGVYDDVPFWLVVEDGLAITGDPGPGDAGFDVAADPANRAYAAGDVVMWADESDRIGTQFAIVDSELIATTLNSAEPAHPIVGTVASGSEVVDSILDVAGAPGGIRPVADVRISAASVADTG